MNKQVSIQADALARAQRFRVARAQHPTRIVVALSGGVDSSVAAWLLCQAGHEVLGVSLRLAPDAPAGTVSHGRCCSHDDLTDARRACDTLGISFYAIDARDTFREEVFDPFVRDYRAGFTPIPCLACNHNVKFGMLYRTARSLHAQLATGHYARIVRRRDGTLALARPLDRQRDQTYYLYGTPPEVLASLQLPLGELDKPLIRALAHKAGLATVAAKPDSHEICFVPDGDHAQVVENAGGAMPKGDVVHINGQRLGNHAGIHHFTVGQRRGTATATGERAYVLDLDPARNRVTLGPKQALACSRIRVSHIRTAVSQKNWPEQVHVQIRARGAPCPARWQWQPQEDALELTFDTPAFAVALGQAAVLYDEDVMLGGGIISARLDTAVPRDATAVAKQF